MQKEISNQVNEPHFFHVVMVVRNEWPLLALSLSHALQNYACCAYVVDTGSSDGTRDGLNLISEIFPGRIKTFSCVDREFDQAAITNIFIDVSNQTQPRWSIVLDGDEFLYLPNYGSLLTSLGSIGEEWEALELSVVNYALGTLYRETEIESIVENSYQVSIRTRGFAALEQHRREWAAELAIPQNQGTMPKLLFRNNSHYFTGPGNHQFLFGDGIDWRRHDSRVATAPDWGWKILHLPYTTLSRFMQRPARSYLPGTNGGEIIVRYPWLENRNEEDLKHFFNTTVIHESRLASYLEKGIITFPNELRASLLSTIDTLKPYWTDIVDLNEHKQVSNQDLIEFKEEIDIETASKIIRRYHSKVDSLWQSS